MKTASSQFLSPSTKSVLSSDSSLAIKFECEENFESIILPSRSYFKDLLIGSSNPSKKDSSLGQEFSMQVITDYPPLEVEEETFCPSTSWRVMDEDYFSSLSANELEYMPNPYAFETIQPELSANMRVVLFDWMIEICSEFLLKRETCYLAMNYMDRVISNVPKIKKIEFQLFSIACMHIASKSEEIHPPKVEDWVRSADGGYTCSQITKTEKLVLNAISFKIHPATAFNWVNWLMSQWDSFVEYHFACVQFNRVEDLEGLPEDERFLEQKRFEKRFIVFKKSNQAAYKRYRETCQVLDAACLRLEYTKILPRVLSGGLLYLMISKYFFETNYTLLYYNGPEYEEKSSKRDNLNFLFGEAGLDTDEDFSDSKNSEGAGVVQVLYSSFLAAALGIGDIEEIFQVVRFLHPLLDIEANYDLPVICKVQSKEKTERHYEEFLNYQTYNPGILQFINKVCRD